MYTFSVHTKEQAQTLQRRSWDKKVIKLYPQCPQEYREAAFKMGSLARDARAASGNTIATRILYAGTTLRLELKVKGCQTWHGHPTLGSFEPSQPLGWEDTCPKEAEAEKTSIAEAIGYEEDQGTNTARPSEQSVTFWCRYWSPDRSRDHFGLENGLEIWSRHSVDDSDDNDNYDDTDNDHDNYLPENLHCRRESRGGCHLLRSH